MALAARANERRETRSGIKEAQQLLKAPFLARLNRTKVDSLSRGLGVLARAKDALSED